MIAWCARSGRETLAGILILTALVVSTGRLTACKGAGGLTQSQVEGGAVVADGVCKLVEGVEENGIVRTLCASVDEVATIVEYILTLRASRDAGPRADVGECKVLPGSTLCATSSERAKGILFVSKVRASRLMLDGGLR